MDYRSLQCCGVQEITGLSDHHSAEEALLSFCNTELKNGSIYLIDKTKAYNKEIYSHYVFTAAVYDEECSFYEAAKQARKNYAKDQKNSTYLRKYTEYGEEFAAYLKEHKLGLVIESPAVFNRAFHPDHKVKVWIWTPDREALIAWFKLREQK